MFKLLGENAEIPYISLCEFQNDIILNGRKQKQTVCTYFSFESAEKSRHGIQAWFNTIKDVNMKQMFTHLNVKFTDGLQCLTLRCYNHDIGNANICFHL